MDPPTTAGSLPQWGGGHTEEEGGELAVLAAESLEKTDIAEMNLRASLGLPGTDQLDIPSLLDRLDEYAEKVKQEIHRHLYRFELAITEEPTRFSYGNSLGRFFCWYMLQVLQVDCGVVYHPDRKFDPDFCKSEDVFIHGILSEDGQGGTCASMPVVYVAVGRRLGLPLYLVSTKGHLFFRWDDPNGTTINWSNPDVSLYIPPERFNVEGTGEGISFNHDAHYMEWPEKWIERDFDHGRYLRSETQQEALAGFLMQRSECFFQLGNFDETLKAIYFARQLVPEDSRYEWMHAKRTHEHNQHVERIMRVSEESRLRLEERMRRPGAHGHSKNCRCRQCEQLRDNPVPVPPHNHTCKCRHCREAVAAANQVTGKPGHQPNCHCSGCLHARRVAQTPSGPQPPQIAAQQPPHIAAQHRNQAFPHVPQPIQPPKPGRNLPGY